MCIKCCAYEYKMQGTFAYCYYTLFSFLILFFHNAKCVPYSLIQLVLFHKIIKLLYLFLNMLQNPYVKVIGSVYVCVCLFIPKDLANRSTDMVLLYNVASHRSWKVYNCFGGESTTLSGEIALKKNFYLKDLIGSTLHSNVPRGFQRRSRQ